MLATLRTTARSPLLQVLKTSVAAIASWLLATLILGQPAPIFAAIAALLVVQPSVNQSLAKGIERSIGVVLGVVIAYVAGRFLGDSTPVVLSIIVVSLLVAWLLRLTPGSSNQIPISAMLVLAIGSQTADYALDRIIETVIGAVVGLVVNALIVPPVLVAPARLAVGRLATAVASSLDRLADALTSELDAAALASLMSDARALRPLQSTAAEALDRAQDSLTLNPRGGRHRVAIEQDRQLLERLGTLVTRTIGMTRAVHDNYDPVLTADPIVGSIAVELRRASHDTTLLARRLAAEGPSTSRRVPQEGSVEVQALTAPLVVARPDPDNWVLVGSLLEDLRRVREEIIGADD